MSKALVKSGFSENGSCKVLKLDCTESDYEAGLDTLRKIRETARRPTGYIRVVDAAEEMNLTATNIRKHMKRLNIKGARYFDDAIKRQAEYISISDAEKIARDYYGVYK
jgi:hypothetical protein